MVDKLAYSIAEAAAALSLSRNAVKELIYTGKLKHVQVGRRKLIPRWALDQFLGQTEATPEAGTDGDSVLKTI